jgi:hypothetical protein
MLDGVAERFGEQGRAMFERFVARLAKIRAQEAPVALVSARRAQ